ncbi:arsenate reductase/protein-tyrosine-phosphatase family protein [Xanthobacter agilis]|uniref:arsenate reductase/protein-tyrosine-phosphatase family protein n=1 Tax=Xanthobacter agilis TaxID=47492 RepID=UPI00372A486B
MAEGIVLHWKRFGRTSALALALMVLGGGWAAAGPLKIAFVDTGNTGRSISAETIARIYALSHDVDARFISRGVNVNPYFVRVEGYAQMLWAQRGVDLSAHEAQQLIVQDVTHSDLILALSSEHKAHIIEMFPQAAGKTFTIAEYAGNGAHDVADAWQQPLPVYENMLAELNAMVPRVVDKAVAAAAQKAKP